MKRLDGKIAVVTGEIFEIARAKIVDHGQTRVRKLFLKAEREIRANKSGSARDEEVE